MNPQEYKSQLRFAETASGKIAYVEQGTGPVALFVHGVLLNGYFWRHQLRQLSGLRRCIAVDLLAHGATEIEPGQDVSSTANAVMLEQFLDAVGIDQVDLVGNDSGGGIGLIFAANNPQRIRSLTLTDCDAHDNWPPEAFKPFLELSATGGLPSALAQMLADKPFFRSPEALGLAYEDSATVASETIDAYLEPLVASPKRTEDVARFLAAFDCAQTVSIETKLRQLKAPTLIVWGTDDIFFPLQWSRWLASAIPGTRRHVDFDGARLYFPEERWQAFNEELRTHWTTMQAAV
jgi:pimeloyl-ACP methyl ester carboxylesterase